MKSTKTLSFTIILIFLQKLVLISPQIEQSINCKKATMSKKVFYPYGGVPKEVSSIKDIVNYMGTFLDGFSKIEEDRGLILIYHQNDPSPICIGEIHYE